ncbi:MAG: archease family protein [Parcubacteria group bacterium Gr01-1014_30]|nr:MAG: archease family protein [Parcubacteria group bacterium Gr01-1014_30]
MFLRNMRNYEILEHKADLKIRVWGETKEELFLNAVLAMQSSLFAEKRKAKSAKRKMSASSPDVSALLVDFLSEVLYLIQTKKEIYSKVNFTKFSDTEVAVELAGQKVARFNQEIKAVTHHGLKVRQRKDGFWETTIIFDV